MEEQVWIAAIIEPAGFVVEPASEHTRIADEAIALVRDGVFTKQLSKRQFTIAHEHVMWLVVHAQL